MSNKIQYIGKDLEAMDFAVNYHRWIYEIIQPFLGKDIVEVGAGTGAFSELLLESKPQTLSLVEPSDMAELLKLNVKGKNEVTKTRIFSNIFAEVAKQIETEQSPDSIIYINVLEHIKDDLLELKLIWQTLNKSGRVFIFVPALPILFSEFDKTIGHYRRYRKVELEKLCQSAGFNLLVCRYFDGPGILPWLVKYRILKSVKMESAAIHLYDRLVVPITKFIENKIRIPVGKNLLIIGEKNVT